MSINIQNQKSTNMKKYFYQWLFLCTMTFIAACSDGGEEIDNPQTPSVPEQPTITLGGSSSSDFPTDGGSNTLSFTASTDWTAEVINSRADAWCSVSPTNGKAGNAQITITTTANDTPDSRSASVILKAGTTQKTITVSQKQKDALTVTSDKFEVSAEGGEIKIEVKANIDFEYSIAYEGSAKDWITSGGARALKTSTLTFKVAANEEVEKREATVTIKSGSFKEEVKVYQAGTTPSITLTKNEFVVASAGESIAVEVKSNVDVTVELPTDVDWISENQSRAMSTNTYHFTIAESQEYDQRTAEIKFTNKANNLSETVKVVQVQKDAIVVAKNEYEFTAEGGELDFEILTNVDVTVSIPDSISNWVKQVKSRALVSQILHFDISPCDLSESRSGTITLSGGNAVQKILIKQDGLKEILEAERNALIAIYKALDGDNWANNTNWCSDKPVSEWEGVECENHFVVHLNLTRLSTSMNGNIPPEIGNLSHLKYLSVSLNTNDDLPKEIGKLKDLEQIYLWLHSDNVKRGIPTCLYDCKNLQVLHLEGECIGGTISSQIGQLQKLRSLSITPNISGPLPDEIGNLLNLEDLSIRGLKELGEIPHSIGNLKKLRNLSLGHMSGDIPKEIGQLSQLETLLFYSEYPITSIPDEIYNLKSLKQLELSFTQFPYTIPEAIGNLTELENLCINYDLTGTIPEAIGNLTKLKYMTLANPYPQGGESLSGNIPESLQKMKYWPYFWADVISGHPYLNTTNLYLPALQIQAEDINGNKIDTNNIYSNNKLTIVYSWDDICPSIIDLHPILKELYSKYAQKGFEIIGYNGGYHEDQIKELANSYNLPWRNFSASRYPFENGQIMAPGFITGLAIVVDSSGKIVYETMTGDYNGLKKYVEKIFNQDVELYESTDYSQDGKVTTLQTATKGNGIDVVIMGDAYSDRQITDGTYKKDMEYVYDNLFTEEPYKSLKDMFNVYYVNIVSKNEGYGTYNETALSSFFGDGTLVGGNDNAVFTYAQKAISAERMDEALLIVAMNSNNYAGTCYMYYPSVTGGYGNGISVSYFPKGENAETFAQLLHHEALGHGFSKLADEYAYESMGAIPATEVTTTKEQQNNWGWWKNVDFTSAPSATRWSHFINDIRYANDGLGAYEGGLTYWTGVWRPTENSIMRYNTGGFNAPSREAIYYRIHKLAYGDSWQYDYEEFVKYDAINRKAAASSYNPYRQTNYKPLHAPVVIRKSWKDAQ
ncbi:MAG: hypothetical protein E7095_00520 [Bacteroides sp.]|nr:hypothetical protein [Bacteroides sp.]